jgi:SAM-dependent methyltransferase
MQQRLSPQDRRPAGWDERGAAAVAAGDLSTAKKCFQSAVRADETNARHRFHLAVVLEGLGDYCGAAEQLTRALRYESRMVDAARRLGDLFDRGALPDQVRLDRKGLIAALAHDTVDRDLIAAAALHHLSHQDPLRRVLRQIDDSGDVIAVARHLCVARTAELLKDDLFLEVLRRGLIGNAPVERLLTAIRRVLLLNVQPSRASDPALVTFVAALMAQCWTHEFAWAEAADETAALESGSIPPDRLLAGDVTAGWAFFVRALYRPLSAINRAGLGADALARVQPAELRGALIARLAEEADIRRRADGIDRLGAIADATSLKVAQQYEASPYPRWTSVRLFRKGHYLKYLETYFDRAELAFTERPFEVLIAGCGTGQQAVSAALDYGPNARVLAIDLSLASLGYASMMAGRLGATNITFMQGDLTEIESFAPSFLGRFQVIECTGVLHHMADPFGAWQKLTRCLAPGGLMLIGLYSAIARRELATLRSEAAYPGPQCDDHALRSYREHLMSAPVGAPGSTYRRGRDFYSSSGFRDFFLHVSERQTTLPEIRDFLGDNGLSFRGLVTAPFAALKNRLPGAVWPGRLDHWAEVEEAHPHMFTSMYQFWCSGPRASGARRG